MLGSAIILDWGFTAPAAQKPDSKACRPVWWFSGSTSTIPWRHLNERNRNWESQRTSPISM